MSTKIHFETHGEGSVTFVICNGLSQSTANWRGFCRQNPQFRWILFDARGHGKSAMGAEPFTLDGHVADLLEVMDKTGADRPLVMGFSHGARVALRAAATSGKRFRALILVSCGSERTVRRRAYVQSWRSCLELGGVEALAWASLPTIVGRKILERFSDWQLMVKGTVARNREEGLLATLEGMAAYPPARGDAVRVHIPTLIMRGEEDALVTQQDTDNLKTWIPNAEVSCFEQSGHTLPLEEPERFLQTIASFAEKHSPD